MNEYFISSRQGQIKNISIHKYNFSPEINEQEAQKRKFCGWLKHRTHFYELKESCFFTFSPMDEQKNWQYDFDSINSIEPPFNDTTIISKYLGKLLRNIYKSNYDQYLNKNIFVIEKLEFSPFRLLKCFEYNIEVFEDGEFYIHFSPTSKNVNLIDITDTYLHKLKNDHENNSHADAMIFSLVKSEGFGRCKFDLLDEHCINKILEFIEEGKRTVATFDGHFIANYSSKIYIEIKKNNAKKLRPSVESLIPISKLIKLPDSIHLHYKPFYKINVSHFAKRNNLCIGSNKKVKEQKVAYHNGIYQPVNGKVIQIVTVDGVKPELFKELIGKFNKGGSVQILEPIKLLSKDRIDMSIFNQLKKQYKDKLLLTIFTKDNQPKDYFEPIRMSGIKHAKYPGQIEKFKLSSYTVKCLEKLDGVLSIIDDTFEPETTYFMGIDLGHTTQTKDQYSNLCVVLFDNKGRLLDRKVIQKISRNEALNLSALKKAMYSVVEKIKKRGLPYPQKLIIHRDGKIHNQDSNIFETVIRKGLKIDNYDIVEIIKSGCPIIAAYNGQKYHNMKAGNSWTLADKRYAILVTNTQADKQGVILNPIVVKHQYGQTDFLELVEQVYWFARVCTYSLYYPTRLPATTIKANNFATTSNKRFISTYTA